MTAHAQAQPAQLPPVVALVGATGTGKSDLAIAVAKGLVEKSVMAEVINADAMQLYRGMDVGTAKLPEAERQGIPHHLLDVWEVSREASVADYQSLARAAIREVQSRGCVPLLVGGSGLYVSSVLYEFEFPGTDPAVRARLEVRAESEGVPALLEELAAKDPLAAAAIDPQNTRRVIRALEVIEITGKPFGAGLDAEHRPWQERTLVFGLHRERDELVTALDKRVRSMWDRGFVDEVRSLIPQGIESGVTASRAIGYQQILEYLAGELSEEDAIESTQSLTRRYARRQVSWFRRDQRTHWLTSGDSAAPDLVGNAILGALS
ncbi:MAG: tRNA (adenosine(37)-N6)-dimethylallyltransferase MiaA [Pontimonas sp.]|nr:tRNA (adenosine(37)-N6)-dimethylallyltransferase MiaA [Pontimonas sp.]